MVTVYKVGNQIVRGLQSTIIASTSNIDIPSDAILCGDINCENQNHKSEFCIIYDKKCELSVLYICSKPFSQRRAKQQKFWPGWNEDVSELYAEAKETFKKTGFHQEKPDLVHSLNIRDPLISD